VRVGVAQRVDSRAALSELTGRLLTTSSFEDLPQQVANPSGRAVPAASTAGSPCPRNGHVIKVTSADALARLLDEQQDEPHNACLQAMRTGTAVLTDDQPKETRRPAYPARVIAHGIRSVPSTPPLIGGRPDRAGEPVRRGGARVRRGINHRGNATHPAGRGHRDRGVAAPQRGQP